MLQTFNCLLGSDDESMLQDGKVLGEICFLDGEVVLDGKRQIVRGIFRYVGAAEVFWNDESGPVILFRNYKFDENILKKRFFC